MGWYAVIGPRDVGPSEREQMLGEAERIFTAEGVEEPQRIDVPQKGTSSGEETGVLRDPVQTVVPALQSGSLFGGSTGVVLVDAHQLLKGEVEALTELLATADPDQATLVLLAAGSLPAPLRKAADASGGIRQVKAVRERDAAAWLASFAKEHGLHIDQEARTELLHTFGSDTAQMRQALEQLAVTGSDIAAGDVRDRFTNRPDEPVWLLGDAIMAGDHGDALRRLADYLHHQHPLAFLAYLEGEVRKRSVAAVVDDFDSFVAVTKANPQSYATKKVWQARTRANGEALASAVRAIARADLAIKTQPEATHRVTLERLTVAMCRWMSR